jgi:hypothetical protein
MYNFSTADVGPTELSGTSVFMMILCRQCATVIAAVSA